MRNCSVRVVNKKQKPMEGVILSTSNNSKAFSTGKDGRALVTDITDADSLYAYLPEKGRVEMPFAGLDSLLITVRSAKKYTVRDAKFDNRTRAISEFDNVPELLKRRPVRSLVELLQGIVPGLNIGYDPSTGQATANIRGMNSINGSSEPLVVVDGIVFDNIGQANSSVDVHSIQSIEVQKDGNMYGVRGANGVIIVHSIGYSSPTL